MTTLLFLLFTVFFYSGCQPSEKVEQKPNIVVIEIDDLGYGDVGAYNPGINFTPNIDRLAEKGMRFTDFHSNGPMCSPTRAAFLTGSYQHRFGERFERALSAKRNDPGLPPEVLSIAELLKEEGYATGKMGKWHLGYEMPYLPTRYGFDEFRGLLTGDGDHHTHISRWGKRDWWHNNDIHMEEGYSVDLITAHSNNFIEKHKDKPFFLYVSHLAIHFPWQGPEDPPHRVFGGNYADDKWGIIKNESNVRPHVVSMIQAVDQSVGKILNKLKEHGLEENTLVIFVSDNGGYTHYYQNEHRFENISDNGPLRGQKTEVYEGGHRVPMIAYWPGTIKEGTVTDETAMTMDFYPTFAKLAGGNISGEKELDGINILPLLQKNQSLPKRSFFWKIGNQWAVRNGPWKLVYDEEKKKALYHLEDDLGESTDLSSQNADQVTQLTDQYLEWKNRMVSASRKWND